MEIQDTMWLPSSTTSTQGVLCPNQRRVPQFGSLVTESIVSIIYSARFVTTVFIAAPVITDLIAGPCYLNNMQSSFLTNCGAEVFSLEDYFNSLYTLNGNFWRIVAIVANVFSPGFPQMFMNGVAMVGENGGVGTLLPGVASQMSSLASTDPTQIMTKLSTTFIAPPGPVQVFMVMFKNPIAMSHFICRMVLRVVVQSIEAAGNERSIGSVFWNVISLGRVDFKDLVTTRMFSVCAGMSLMSGYSTPLGSVVRHYCNAGVNGIDASMNLLAAFTVDIPIMACVCKKGQGYNMQAWISSGECDVPDNMKVTIRHLLADGNGCESAVAMVVNDVKSAMDEVFGEMNAGTSYVGSVLDSFISLIDSNAGQCNNYETNPYVTTIIPQPVDYFRMCGKTHVCYERCKQQMDAFNQVAPSSVRTRSATTAVNSLFFPDIANVDANTPFPSGFIDIMEISDCVDSGCLETDRCLIVTGFVVNQLYVKTYCVPYSLTRSVTKSGEWSTLGIPPGCFNVKIVYAMMQYMVIGMEEQVIHSCQKYRCFTATVQQFCDTCLVFTNMAVVNGNLLVQVQTSDIGLQSFSMTVSQSPVIQSCSSNIWDIGLYHLVSRLDLDGNYILIPYDDLPFLVCQLDQFSMTNCMSYSGFDYHIVPAITRGKQSRMASNSLSAKGLSVFVATTSSSDWLEILSMDVLSDTISGASIQNSVPTTISYYLQQTCSLDSCIGCQQLGVQRLCYAAQQCQIGRCIGTTVNQIRPLCAVGGALQASIYTYIAAMDGVWLMISESMVSVLKVSGGVALSRVVSWPDDAFFGIVCSLKDVTASQASIITGTINGIVQTTVPMATLAMGKAVDNRFLAVFSLTMQAVTSFLFQLALMPLYSIIAVQKTVVCQTNGLIAMVLGDDAVQIGDPAFQKASDNAVGQCMSQMVNENAQGEGSGVDNDNSFSGSASRVLERVAKFSSSIQLDILIHPIDATFTYIQGLIISFQDVLQTADQQHCRLPDFTSRNLYQCPCGDQAVMIPEERQRETFLDGAYWCSTIMSMLNYDGKARYVWNPYSLAQLKDIISPTLDTYLECVASKNDGSCVAPSDPVFDKQQIPLLSVYQRCITNYQEMQWDQGTFLLFNRTLQRSLRLQGIPETSAIDTFNVAECLLTQQINGNTNLGCLNDYFLQGTNAYDYFYYSNITGSVSGQRVASSSTVDACLTFSGPARTLETSATNTTGPNAFRKCLDTYSDRDGCDIPMMMWTGRSTNKVPVAAQHTMRITDESVRMASALGDMQEAQSAVMHALDLMKSWSGDGIEISIFSSEGDALHQFADCVMMGPLSSMVFTPGPDEVEKVVWARRADDYSSRIFDLPCSGEKLKGRNGTQRDNKPPFTCGTPARRAVMKYFVRDGMKGGSYINNSAAKSYVVQAVKELINRTRAAWSIQENMYCKCADGSVGFKCCLENSQCSLDPCPCPDGFGVTNSVACCQSNCPGLMGNGLKIEFAKVQGEQLAASLFNDMATFLTSNVWTNPDVWLKYDVGGAAAYKQSWSDASFHVADLGLFDSSVPVYYYNETNYPLKHSFTEHCVGLLQQIIWTMPQDVQYGNVKIPKTEFNPMGESQTLNLTYQEEFVRNLVREAYLKSPLFWHYNVRYRPSPSVMCRRPYVKPSSKPSVTIPNSNTVIQQYGASAYTLGGVGSDCFCGWWAPVTNPVSVYVCKIPDDVCTQLVQFVGMTRICITQKGGYNPVDHRDVVQSLIPSITYSCPMSKLSDLWGFDNSSGSILSGTVMYDTILKEGLNGFRVGNMQWLYDSQDVYTHSKTRVEQLENKNTNVGLDCSSNITSLADNFVDDLFPVSQGVRQNVGISYCMRYGIELARLTMYQSLGLNTAAASQSSVVLSWKDRCKYKLQEYSLCKAFGMWKPTTLDRTSTDHCPFTIPVQFNGYFYVTAGCLVFVNLTSNANFHSAVNGFYDPCLCFDCVKSPTIRVIDLSNLGVACIIDTSYPLVNNVVPGSATFDEMLGSGNFRDLLQKPNIYNTNAQSNGKHWAMQDTILHADLIQDWWPDEWRFPVGYHVTPQCVTAHADATWKTFDSSWVWNYATGEMVHTKEINDPLLSRNNLGATGFCRANNYGMPMTLLNTMTTCTTDYNVAVDPTVPTLPLTATESSLLNNEYCSSSPFDTPWAVNKMTNAPNEWAVGNLMTGVLDPYSATTWGPSCSPYQTRTCARDSDCVSGLVCLVSESGDGLCSVLSQSSFQCMTHNHCAGDQLCSGDGLCVDGLWQVNNSINESITFRSYAQNCPDVAVDMWGVSAMEHIPDILKSSGMCSYRAWFENRKMAVKNQCANDPNSLTSYQTCGFDGNQRWNYTSPDQRTAGGAFTNNILKVNGHGCDRNYQHIQDQKSCFANPNNMRLFNYQGTLVTYDTKYGKKTRTYTRDKKLALMRHVETTPTSTFGLTGVPNTYSGLNLGTANSAVIACKDLGVCGLQPEFYVNGNVFNRRVIDGTINRVYSVTDLLKCNVVGFWNEVTCVLDPAITMMVSVMKAKYSAWGLGSLNVFSSSYALLSTGTYTTLNKDSITTAVNTVNSLFLSAYVGAAPTTLQDYIDKSAKFVTMYNALLEISSSSSVPSYNGTVKPLQLYYVTKYAAHEYPFEWWYRCAWMQGFAPGTTVVDCMWTGESNAAQATMGNGAQFSAASDLLSRMLSGGKTLTQPLPPQPNSGSLLTLLQKLTMTDGYLTMQDITDASTAFKWKRNNVTAQILGLLRDVNRRCYSKQNFNKDLLAVSETYQQAVYQFGLGADFDATRSFNNSLGGIVCKGDSCFTHSDVVVPMDSYLVTEMQNLLYAKNVVVDMGLSLSTTNALFTTTGTGVTLSNFWTFSTLTDTQLSDLRVKYTTTDVTGTGSLCTISREICNGGVNSCMCACTDWGTCSSTLKAFIRRSDSTLRETPTQKPLLNITATGSLNPISLDVCATLAGTSDWSKCFTSRRDSDNVSLDLGVDQYLITQLQIPTGVNVEKYVEKSWTCRLMTCFNPYNPECEDPSNPLCVDTSNPLHNKYVDVDNNGATIDMNENVKVTEIVYEQPVFNRASRSGSGWDTFESKSMFMSNPACTVPDWRDYLRAVGNNQCGNLPNVVSEYDSSYTLKKYTIEYTSATKNTIKFDLHSCGSVLWEQWLKENKDIPISSSIKSIVCRTDAQIVIDDDQVDMATVTTNGNINYNSDIRNRINRILKDGYDTCAGMSNCNRQSITRNPSVYVSKDIMTVKPSDVQQTCKKIKTNKYLGCSLYPGDKTHTIGGEQDDTANGMCFFNYLPDEVQQVMLSYYRWGDCRWALMYCWDNSGSSPHIDNCMTDFFKSNSFKYNSIGLGECSTDGIKKTYRYFNQERCTWKMDNYCWCRQQIQYPIYNKCVSDTWIYEPSYDTTISVTDSGKINSCELDLSFDGSMKFPMNVVVNKYAYVYTTTKPLCKAGPNLKCNLKQDLQNNPNTIPVNAPCPGTDVNLKRYNDYRLLVGDQIHESNPPSVATDPFNHMFWSIKLGYQCNNAVCPKDQLSIQVYRDLYACKECPRIPLTYCQGNHNCFIKSPRFTSDQLTQIPGWSALSVAHQQYLLGVDSGIAVAMPALNWFYNTLSSSAIASGTLSTRALPFAFGKPYTYNPLDDVAYTTYMVTQASTCSAGNVADMPKFAECNYQGHKVNLRTFFGKNYKIDEGVIIPSWHTLSWKVKKAQVMGRNIPAWETVAKTDQFVSDLLDDAWCETGSVYDNFCYRSGTKIEALIPLLFDEFEPKVGCDVSLTTNKISSLCINDVCTVTNEYIQHETGLMSCPNDNLPSSKSIKQDARSNLCSKRPSSTGSTCSAMKQGVIGQRSYNGESLANLYDATVAFNENNNFKGGVLSGTNPLFNGIGLLSLDYSTSIPFLSLSQYDIGGHNIIFALTTQGNNNILKIQSMPLLSYTDALSASAYSIRTNTNWLANWLLSRDLEAQSLTTIYPSSVCKSWDCPLKRRVFYMGIDKLFRPQHPDPQRSFFMYGQRSHPTQVAQPIPDNILGIYKSSNGFCVCDTPPCTHCSINEQINALRELWQNASVSTSVACMQQMDWPMFGGTLRDGLVYPSRTPVQKCNILNRLPIFKYRFKNSQKFTKATNTTLDKGGVCHMGRPIITSNTLKNCYLKSDTQLNCTSDIVQRVRPLSMIQLLQQRSRPRLEQCNPPPVYRAGTKQVDSEVSYGQLQRRQVSRLLSADLRKLLCGNATTCNPPNVNMPAESEINNFWAWYTRNLPIPPDPNTVPLTDKEKSLWNTSWVACSQKNGTQNCSGVLSRAQWLSESKTSTCNKVVTENGDKLVQDLNICDLDSTLDMFCRAIQDARYKVFEANCQYSGQCRKQLYFYQPSTFSVDNNEFVRSTVQSFYNNIQPESCPVDADTLESITKNAGLIGKCPAVALEPIKQMLLSVRTVVELIVQVIYYANMLVFNILRMLVSITPTQQQAVIQDITNTLKALATNFKKLFDTLGDMFYKIIFQTPLGKWLISLIEILCGVVNLILRDLIHPLMCFIRSAAIGFLDVFARGFMAAINVIAFGKLGYVDDQISDAIKVVKSSVPCENQTFLSCSFSVTVDTTPVLTLPLPTRCFGGVAASDLNLQCKASDTCMDENFNIIICAMCPKASSMIKFGCNSLTKLCSCNVFPVGVTQCSSHEECQIQDSDIACQYTDSYLQKSYGNTPCTQCSAPICLFDSSGTGTCSCLLRSVAYQTCANVGQRVSLSGSELCLVASSDSGSLSQSTAYSEAYRSLAAVPCALINAAEAFCMNVYTGSDSSGYSSLVVGLKMLRPGRRLLLDGGFEDVAEISSFELIESLSDWDNATEPCRTLIVSSIRSYYQDGTVGNATFAQPMGILEQQYKKDCIRWRSIGVRLVTQLNMTGVSPNFLLSPGDFVNAVTSVTGVPHIMNNMPSIATTVVMHMEMTQPVYYIAAYWLNMLPDYVWERQYALTSLRLFFVRLFMLHDEDIDLNSTSVNASLTALENAFIDHSTNGYWRVFGVNTFDKFNMSSFTHHSQHRSDKSTTLLDTTVSPKTVFQDTQQTLSRYSSRGRRRTMRRVLATSSVIDNTLSDSQTKLWSEGPYAWPVNYKYYDSNQTCAIVSTVVNVMINGASETAKFYQISSVAVVEDKPFWSGVADIIIPDVFNDFSFDDIEKSFKTVSYKLMNAFIDVRSIKTWFLVDRVWVDIILKFIRCDFTKMQNCGNRETLLWVGLKVLFVFFIVSVMAKVLEIPYVDLLLAVFFLPVILSINYQYSFTCGLMLPTCFINDIMSLLEFILPDKITYPNELFAKTGCTNTTDCFVDCTTDTRFRFDNWQDHAAWLLWETSSNMSVKLANGISQDNMFSKMFIPMKESILMKSKLVTNTSMTHAQRLCFAVTIANSLPVFLLITVALILIPIVLSFAVAFALWVVQSVIGLLIFIHVED